MSAIARASVVTTLVGLTLLGACSDSIDRGDVVIGCVATSDVDPAMRDAIALFESTGQRLAEISVARSVPGIEIVVAPGSDEDERADLAALVAEVDRVVEVTNDRDACQ